MYIRSLFFAFLIAALAACQDHSGADFMVPPSGGQTPDARVWLDAHEYLDARVYEDAHVYMDAHLYEDAHVYNDAHVYMDAHVYDDAAIVRDCVNKSAPPPFNGHETLELAITCQNLSETGTLTHVALHGVVSSTDAGTVITTSTTFTLQCGTAYGVPANNFIDLTTADTLTATSISATAFDVPCL